MIYNLFDRFFYVALFFLLLSGKPVWAQRIERTINESWQFHKGGLEEPANCEDSISWETVSIPHTWNDLDSSDETVGYYRGEGWYRRTVSILGPMRGRSFYLHFEGVNQEAELYVNGRQVGQHKGGYAAFCFDITDFVHPGENTFAVRVDNRPNPQIPPLSADFTFFGGIYRDVTLIVTDAVHISTTHYATNGVYLSTPDVDRDEADVKIRALLTNGRETAASVVLTHTFVAPDGAVVATARRSVKLPAVCENYEVTLSVHVDNPQLWDIDNPRLYRVDTSLSDAEGRELDAVANSLGLRWYDFDPNRGFILNDRPCKLIGTSRHQDYYRLGNALRDEMHVRDVRLLKEMGGNFLRVAHYPQDPVILQMCDRLGILASVEIPIVNAVTMTPEFEAICLEMAREMVFQNFNAPSVVMWSYMNEVLLRPPYDKKDEIAKRTYMDYVYQIASRIESTLRELDPERYTMLPCHGNSGLYAECGIAALPKILGWNLYHGWYSNGFDGFPRTLEKLHRQFPDKSLLVTEYGADADPRLHSYDSERFDFSCEYAVRYHRYYIPEILKRDWLAGAAIWNLNDFYSESRRDAVPNVNNKGITGLDREIKDSYYLYQATLRQSPVLHIGGHDWIYRGGAADSTGRCPQPVEIYTNASEVELFHNGVSLGKAPVEGVTARFIVPFVDGTNQLEAVAERGGNKLHDLLRVDFRMLPFDLKDVRHPFEEMNVMLGSKRYFEDRRAGMVWIPEQPFSPGSWGYVGGEPYRARTRYGSLPCSDIDVLGTNDDPVFQTQRRGLEGFRADVPDGRYYVYLYWAELVSDKEHASLAYNLGNDIVGGQESDRVFDVSINDTSVLTAFDLARECGEERAVIKRFTVDVSDGRGINVRFTARRGEPVLNAIRIYRCF